MRLDKNKGHRMHESPFRSPTLSERVLRRYFRGVVGLAIDSSVQLLLDVLPDVLPPHVTN